MEYLAYSTIEPFGPGGDDLRLAYLASFFATKKNSNKSPKLKELLPPWSQEDEEQGPQSIEELNALLGGEDTR